MIEQKNMPLNRSRLHFLNKDSYIRLISSKYLIECVEAPLSDISYIKLGKLEE